MAIGFKRCCGTGVCCGLGARKSFGISRTCAGSAKPTTPELTTPCGRCPSSDAYCLPDISLVPAGHVVTPPEIRFVNPIVQKHLVPTFRADWLLFQAVLSFLIRDYASLGATEPI